MTVCNTKNTSLQGEKDTCWFPFLLHCTIFLRFIKGIPLQARRNLRGSQLERKSDGFLYFLQISKQLVKLTSIPAGPGKVGSNKPSKHKPKSPNDALQIIFSVRKARREHVLYSLTCNSKLAPSCRSAHPSVLTCALLQCIRCPGKYVQKNSSVLLQQLSCHFQVSILSPFKSVTSAKDCQKKCFSYFSTQSSYLCWQKSMCHSLPHISLLMSVLV